MRTTTHKVWLMFDCVCDDCGTIAWKNMYTLKETYMDGCPICRQCGNPLTLLEEVEVRE